MRKEDCLFCKIVAGEIPSAKVYEDDRVLAFEDVNPQMPVHTLIVPKNHYDNIGDGIPDDEMGYLFNTVKKIAELKANPATMDMDAVVNDRFIVVPGMAMFPSLECMDAVEMIAAGLRPDEAA